MLATQCTTTILQKGNCITKTAPQNVPSPMSLRQVMNLWPVPWHTTASNSHQSTSHVQRKHLRPPSNLVAHSKVWKVNGGSTWDTTPSGTATHASISMQILLSKIQIGVHRLLDQTDPYKHLAITTPIRMTSSRWLAPNTSDRHGNFQTWNQANQSISTMTTWDQRTMRPGTFWKHLQTT